MGNYNKKPWKQGRKNTSRKVWEPQILSEFLPKLEERIIITQEEADIICQTIPETETNPQIGCWTKAKFGFHTANLTMFNNMVMIEGSTTLILTIKNILYKENEYGLEKGNQYQEEILDNYRDLDLRPIVD